MNGQALTVGFVRREAWPGEAAALVGFTGLFGGAAHYAVVLAGRSEREVERATGFGFFFGFGLGTLVLATTPRRDLRCSYGYPRFALFALSTAAVTGLVLLLNGLDVGAGIAVAVLGLVAVMSGAALGYLSDRLPELPQARPAHRTASAHRGD